MLTGTTGKGKSAACNFFMQKCTLESRASVSESMVATIDGKRVELIDTPGFLDPISVVEDNERLEFAKGLINMKCGFHVLGVVLDATKCIGAAEDRVFKNLLSIYKQYLPYVVIIFTRGIFLGSTEEEQKAELQHMIKEMKEKEKTSNFCQVLEKINHRYIVLESVFPVEQGYHASKSKELVKMIDTILKQTGKPATNDFALAMAESLKEAEVDRPTLIKELADRINTAITTMTAAQSNAFFTFLLHAMIKGGGRLATLGRAISTVKDYASTAYSYASEKCTFQ